MTRITITIDDTHLGDIDQVARALADHGMEVDRVMPATGFIIGSIETGTEVMYRSIPGVMSVDASREIRLPDPGSDLQ